MKKISLGISPCPNDTFIFDALIHHKIDTEGLSFELVMEDVEQLNQLALKAVLHLTKISYGVLPFLVKSYNLLESGGALGTGVGPLLITQSGEKKLFPQDNIGIPGKFTTANFLFKHFYPQHSETTALVFNEIEQAILDKKIDAGVIIHENRFTYAAKGLHCMADLGQLWEEEYQLPIPLGGIVVQKQIETHLAKKINTLIKKSIAYAYKNHSEKTPFVVENADAMQSDIIQKHIQLYVNEYSYSIGAKGKKAIEKILALYSINPTDFCVIEE